MSTVGIVYNGGELLRTLQDNESNIIAGNRASSQPKNNVSVISSLALSQQQQQQQQQLDKTLPAYDPSRLKKHGKNGQPPPIAVAKRNARERNRVKQVNNGFAKLRQHIPSHVAQGFGDRGKKLSKVETLRMAVEYIRGLQRLLAEADGLDPDLGAKLRDATSDSSAMIPSPTGSLYSSSTQNGSLGLDEQHHRLMHEDDEDDDDDDDEDHELENDQPSNKRAPGKRFRPQSSCHYKQACFGDQENIEPLTSSRNHNNNNHSHNNNNVLAGFSPRPTSDCPPMIKREAQPRDKDESRRSSEDDSTVNVLASTSPPYSGEIFIENPETGRLVPLKIEDHEAVLVAAAAEPAAYYYYKSELPDGAAELSWWEHECIVQQIQQQQQQQQSSSRSLAHA